METAWPIEMLRQIAAKKVLTLHFFDEIEVYLGYPLMLAEKLGLKLAVQEMLYFRCSALTQKDLDEAATTVLQKKQDRDAECSFLCRKKNGKQLFERNIQSVVKKSMKLPMMMMYIRH